MPRPTTSTCRASTSAGGGREDNLEKAVAYYEQAAPARSGYAPAWVGLADVHTVQAGHGFIALDEGYRKARQEVEKALDLDPNLAEAHAVLGRIRRTADWDWAGADAAYQRALELEPGNARAITCAGRLADTLGRFDHAIELYRRAVELDPLSVSAHISLGGSAAYLGRLDGSGGGLPQGARAQPRVPGVAFLSRPDRAVAIPAGGSAPGDREGEATPSGAVRSGASPITPSAGGGRRMRPWPSFWRDKDDSAVQIAGVYAFRGENGQGFRVARARVRAAGSRRERLQGLSVVQEIEKDPRFKAFLEKMRLPV